MHCIPFRQKCGASRLINAIVSIRFLGIWNQKVALWHITHEHYAMMSHVFFFYVTKFTNMYKHDNSVIINS